MKKSSPYYKQSSPNRQRRMKLLHWHPHPHLNKKSTRHQRIQSRCKCFKSSSKSNKIYNGTTMVTTLMMTTMPIKPECTKKHQTTPDEHEATHPSIVGLTEPAATGQQTAKWKPPDTKMKPHLKMDSGDQMRIVLNVLNDMQSQTIS